ncbi:hypothetical protein E4U42_002787 [Claviceps africana]|uniref:Uncharacterized protein n=1 Tax=Claviceps africana TaxID=83212 RepID=A0A8K0J875_9HYPO|nr:hypothetical protein E4U42_002787 [Claviceps africana]
MASKENLVGSNQAPSQPSRARNHADYTELGTFKQQICRTEGLTMSALGACGKSLAGLAKWVQKGEYAMIPVLEASPSLES